MTDLVLLDIKHSLPEGHETLTGQKQEHILEFLDALDQAKIPVVIRHVVVPGITDGEEELTALGRILAPHRNIRGLEILPYHTMGIAKYKNLGLDYPLEGVPQMEPEAAKQAKAKILAVIKECRNK